MVIYASEVLQWRESRDQKVLTGRKLAIERAVTTTSQRVGAASSIWTNKTRSFAAAWALSNKVSGQRRTEGQRQRVMLPGPEKGCMKGSEECGSKVHGDMTSKDRTSILDDCAKKTLDGAQ